MNEKKRSFVNPKSMAILGTLVLGGVLIASNAYAFGLGTSPSLTEEQKNVLQEARELRESGDREGAQELLKNIGVDLKALRADRKLHKEEMKKKHDEIKTAILNNDYNLFKELTADAPIKDGVTKEIFAKMVEAHQLRESGDMEGAKEIMKEIGFNQNHHGHHGEGKGEGFRHQEGHEEDSE